MTDNLEEAKRHIRELLRLADIAMETIRFDVDGKPHDGLPPEYINAQSFLTRLDSEGQTVEGGEHDRKIRDDVLEEAAKCMDALRWDGEQQPELGQRIRSLKSQPVEEGGT
jgi:hypothetical protein